MREEARARREITRLFCGDADIHNRDWIVNIVKAVGNYGEVFDRNVGSGSPLGINRGLNNLWNKGGLQYAPPIR